MHKAEEMKNEKCLYISLQQIAPLKETLENKSTQKTLFSFNLSASAYVNHSLFLH